MGSLSSSPKAPQQSQIVYVPSTPEPSNPVVDNDSANVDDGGGSSDEAVKNRRQSLLSRNRSRFGTIATSFQGFVGNENANSRKTLLGE
ncbi:MAG: hypothetical protein ACRBB3_04670 [Alphaproteobacteria bacterium]